MLEGECVELPCVGFWGGIDCSVAAGPIKGIQALPRIRGIFLRAFSFLMGPGRAFRFVPHGFRSAREYQEVSMVVRNVTKGLDRFAIPLVRGSAVTGRAWKGKGGLPFGPKERYRSCRG